MKQILNYAFISLLVICQPAAEAQQDGGLRRAPGGGGDRGSFGGRGGGFGDRGNRSSFGGGPPPGGFGGGPPGGGRSMIDRNGDGRVDQAEIDQMPEGFRQMMESRGIQLRAGVSTDEFRENMRRQFEQMRQEGGSPFVRPPAAGGAPDQAANRGQYAPSVSFRPREKERMTIDLPPKYSELDSDFDGQVGLYEWITARRETLELFDQIDIDSDGLLTPAELKDYDEQTADASKQILAFAEKYKRQRLMIVGGSAATAAKGGSKDGGKSKLSKEDIQRHQESATRFFPFMDRDKDGKISMEEFENSRRLKPMFESAGIKIEPMSQEQFTKNYIKAMEAAGSNGGGDRGNGGGDRGGDRGGRGGSGGR